ncbi:hypothetical protein ALO91_102848 [Pseudomonas syringae pv. aceris]|uniref:Uncharacterized protein n=1 Tax=Pseudomonas syringae pv. aceris TaxID=199198 RepID=A0A0N8QEQ7_PSESX|nr:hypothetical protein ALO91_102848 [Pseudomonas syringae pv. aceris]
MTQYWCIKESDLQVMIFERVCSSRGSLFVCFFVRSFMHVCRFDVNETGNR